MNNDFKEFLLPSLNLTYDYILLNDNDKALDTITLVIELSRFLFKSSNDIIKIEDEIIMLDKYLLIQSIRYNEVFKYTIKNDTERLLYVNRGQLLSQLIQLFNNKIENMMHVEQIDLIISFENNSDSPALKLDMCMGKEIKDEMED